MVVGVGVRMIAAGVRAVIMAATARIMSARSGFPACIQVDAAAPMIVRTTTVRMRPSLAVATKQRFAGRLGLRLAPIGAAIVLAGIGVGMRMAVGVIVRATRMPRIGLAA
ncbi:hypothetical protein X946_5099 [Burkholderia sp. ABCPW 111]|nr:hypothetical protein X946_5099 [Burkholderia sp. ABCPW 111]